MHFCHKCSVEWVSEKKRPGYREFCDNCTAYLHVCKNCRFYEPGAHNSCHIGTTELVADKTQGNYCDEFEFADSEQNLASAKENNARSAFDELFGGKVKGDTKRDSSDFDRLFGD